MKSKRECWLRTSDVARRIDRSAELVRHLERTGQLAAERCVGGQRLFRASEVEAYLQRRAEREAAR